MGVVVAVIPLGTHFTRSIVAGLIGVCRAGMHGLAWLIARGAGAVVVRCRSSACQSVSTGGPAVHVLGAVVLVFSTAEVMGRGGEVGVKRRERVLRGVSIVVVDFLWLAGSRERLLVVWGCGVSSVAGLASVIHGWDSGDTSLTADIVVVVRY